MKSRYRLFVTSIGSPLAVGMAALGCSNEPKTPPRSVVELTSAGGGNFTFAPAVGTHFVRIEQRTVDYLLVGTPLSRREEQELRWDVGVHWSGDRYVVKQMLKHIVVKFNGAAQMDANVPERAIAAELVLDRVGNLMDVRGFNDTSSTLQSLTLPNVKLDAIQERQLSAESLKAMTTTRYAVLTGDMVGRPSMPGASWTVPGQSYGPVLATTVAVQHMEPCGTVPCARVREESKLDPSPLRAAVEGLVKKRVEQLGGDGSSVQIKSALWSTAGTLAVEPGTLLGHEGTISETGTVVASSGKRDFEVAVSGKTQYSFDYSQPKVSQATDGTSERLVVEVSR
jgi:hypothetical protein